MSAKKLGTLVNKQINLELFSAYLYWEIANYYREYGLAGFANWYEVQAKEEMDHAELLRNALLNQGEKVSLSAIAAPEIKFSNIAEPLSFSLKHEKAVTAGLAQIHEAAMDQKNAFMVNTLNWFLSEQAEEEKNSADLIRNYELFAKDGSGLYQMDQQMGQRMYVAPSLVVEA